MSATMDDVRPLRLAQADYEREAYTEQRPVVGFFSARSNIAEPIDGALINSYVRMVRADLEREAVIHYVQSLDMAKTMARVHQNAQSAKKVPFIQPLLGAALAGAVLAGLTFGWTDFHEGARIVGAAIFVTAYLAWRSSR